MSQVFIKEAEVITSLGNDPETLYTALLEGKNGFSKVRRFNTAPYASKIAGLIPGLCGAKKDVLADLTLKLIHRIPAPTPDSLLITASTKGNINALQHLTGTMPATCPGLPVSGLPGHLAGEIGLKRPGFNISAACASSTIALAKAADLIRTGREQSVIVLAADLVTEFVYSGFSAIGAMGPGPAMPFDRDRKGLTLGEGAAVILLTSKKGLKHKKPLAELAGWGIANDAVHLTAPDRNASGLKAAIVRACKTGGIYTDDIRVFNTHGTGTRHNDAMELTAIHDLFDPQKIVAGSVKGSIGHTLGAAGAIETALCVKFLEHRMIPGTKGFKTPDEGAAHIFSPRNRHFNNGAVLTTNSGFGGINAALILRETK